MNGIDTSRQWPVAWSAVWVGALAALAVAIVIGLIGFAVGAHEVSRAASWRNVRLLSLIFNVGGAFFSFVVGGWVAARIGGFERAEMATLHGAIVWLLTIPMLLALAMARSVWFFGGWYVGLMSPLAASSSQDLAAGVRNGAIAATAALLIGLMGAVIGGWMASGEPMTLSARRLRAELSRFRRAA
jgi:hypothetical protein